MKINNKITTSVLLCMVMFLLIPSVSAASCENVTGEWRCYGTSNIWEVYNLIGDENTLSWNTSGFDYYILHEPLNLFTDNTTFNFSEEVRLKSINIDGENDRGITYITWNGTVNFNQANITSWNNVTNSSAPTSDTYRAYIFSGINSTYSPARPANGSISNSNFSYLGYNAFNKTGVTLNGYNRSTISDNTFIKNYKGLHLSNSSNNNVSWNEYNASVSDGLVIYMSDGNATNNNTVSYSSSYDNGGIGISVYSSNTNNIFNNSVYENTLAGITLDTSDSNTITDNSVYWNTGDGIYIITTSTSNIFTSNNVYANGLDGFRLVSSTDNTFTSNNVSNTLGIYHDYQFNTDSDGNTIITNYNQSNFFSVDNSINNVKFSNSTYTYTYGFDTTASVFNDNITLGSEITNMTVSTGEVDWFNITSGLTASTGYALRYSLNDTLVLGGSSGSDTYFNFTPLELGGSNKYYTIAAGVPIASAILVEGESAPQNLNPNLANGTTPWFKWTYTDSDSDPQTSYEVWVGTSSGASDMWNSGEVSSAVQGAAYAGIALDNGVVYYVQVRVNDSSVVSGWTTSTFRYNPGTSDTGISSMRTVYGNTLSSIEMASLLAIVIGAALVLTVIGIIVMITQGVEVSPDLIKTIGIAVLTIVIIGVLFLVFVIINDSLLDTVLYG